LAEEQVGVKNERDQAKNKWPKKSACLEVKKRQDMTLQAIRQELGAIGKEPSETQGKDGIDDEITI
jgi:hypothetical protein